MQTVTLQRRETCRQARETLLWNALKTIPRRLEDLKFRKGIVLKSFQNNVYLVLILPVCKIAVCSFRTQVPPHGAISMLRKRALTFATRLPNDKRQVHRQLTDRRSTVQFRKTVRRLSIVCRPTVARSSTDCWSTVGRLLVDKQPTDFWGSSSSIYSVLTYTSKCLIRRKQWVNSDQETTENFDL